MWQGIIDQKEKWIGGKLIDYGDSMERAVLKEGLLPAETTITGFSLTDDYFAVEGADFNCGGARDVLGLTSTSVENGLAIFGIFGHRFDIVRAD